MPAVSVGVVHIQGVYFAIALFFDLRNLFSFSATNADLAIEWGTTSGAVQLPSDLILPWAAIKRNIIAARLEAHFSIIFVAVVKGV